MAMRVNFAFRHSGLQSLYRRIAAAGIFFHEQSEGPPRLQTDGTAGMDTLDWLAGVSIRI